MRNQLRELEARMERLENLANKYRTVRGFPIRQARERMLQDMLADIQSEIVEYNFSDWDELHSRPWRI